jgi:hypothetical protein
MKRLPLIVLIFLLLSPIRAAAEEIPVLLMIKSSEQSDTSGCNFVEELTELIYNEILNKKVTLWDSKAKEIALSPATLLQIEKNSHVSFTKLETIFIYELWEAGKNELVTRTLGFSFIHRTEKDEVSFGYIDYSDVEKALLSNRINTNANGIYSSTFTTYILSKKYAFNIVQFNGQPVKTTGESSDILKTYVRGLPYNSSLLGYYPPDKFVSSIVDTFTDGTDSKSLNSKALVKAIEHFLSTNEEEFYNLGGDRILSYLQKNKIKVTRVEVNEMWRKVVGELKIETRSITIFVNDSALKTLSPLEYSQLGILVGDKPLQDVLDERDYNYIITRINSQEIRRQDSYIYQRALLNAEWNRVIAYVLGF